MNSLKITYMVCDLIITIVLLALAVAAPIWITPGYYWWTAFAIVCLMSEGEAYSKRLDRWKL